MVFFSRAMLLGMFVGSVAFVPTKSHSLARYFTVYGGIGAPFVSPSFTVTEENQQSPDSSGFDVSKPDSSVNFALEFELYGSLYGLFEYIDYGKSEVVTPNSGRGDLDYIVVSSRGGLQFPSKTYGFHVFVESGISTIRFEGSARRLTNSAGQRIVLTRGESLLGFAGGVNYYFENGIGIQLGYNRTSNVYQNIALNIGYRYSLFAEETVVVDNESGVNLRSQYDGAQNEVENAPKSKTLNVGSGLIWRDSDDDGVIDEADACPDTPIGQAVNIQGCVDLTPAEPFDVEIEGNYQQILSRLFPDESELKDGSGLFVDRTINSLSDIPYSSSNDIIPKTEFSSRYSGALDSPAINGADQSRSEKPAQLEQTNNEPAHIKPTQQDGETPYQALTSDGTVPLGLPHIGARIPEHIVAASKRTNNGKQPLQDESAGLAGEVVLFDINSSELKKAQREKLNRLGKELLNDPNKRIQLSAYAGTQPTVAYNQWLANRRALNVKAYFLQRGVAENQIVYQAQGSVSSILVDASRSKRVFIRFLP